EDDERQREASARGESRGQTGEDQRLRGHPRREEWLDAGEDPLGAVVPGEGHENGQTKESEPRRHDGTRKQPAAAEKRHLQHERQRRGRRLDAQQPAGGREEGAENRISVLRAETKKQVLAEGSRGQTSECLKGIEARIVKQPAVAMGESP